MAMYPAERRKTVIEVARRAAGVSQAQLAVWAGTQQSSVSEYESRRKSPTLEVVERLLAAVDYELAIRPVVDFDVRQDPEMGQYVVPERLWSVPMPDCFSKIQVFGPLFESRRPRVWDLSVEAERVEFYEWVIGRGAIDLMLDSVDGILLMQVWDRLEPPGGDPRSLAAGDRRGHRPSGHGPATRPGSAPGSPRRLAWSGGRSDGASRVTDSQADLQADLPGIS